MEPHFLFTLLLLLLPFMVLMKKLITQLSRTNVKVANLPPSPRRLPFVGHIHLFLGSLPHRALHKLAQRHGPLMYLKLGQVDHIIVSSAEVAREFLKTHELNFADRPNLVVSSILTYDNRNIAFSPYGSYWRQLRKICAVELLSARRVRAFGSVREDEISSLMSFVSMSGGRSPINLTQGLLKLTNMITSRSAFSTRCTHGQRFISAVQTAAQIGSSGFALADLYPSFGFVDVLSGFTSKVKAAHSKADEILDEILEEHQAKRATNSNPSEGKQEEEDLVDVLLRLKESGELELPLTNLNIKAVIFDMFAAGTDTSSSVLDWAMTELISHPEVMKKAQTEVRRVLMGKTRIRNEDMDELHYMKSIIKEALRLHPPIPLLIPRACRETCNMMGYEIPQGSRVIINVWAIAQDPKHWEDPESFKPERFDGSSMEYNGSNFEFIPFGSGRRICPGMTFGLAIVELALANLLYHFNWELPDGMTHDKLDMTESSAVSVSRKEDLWLIATRYTPSNEQDDSS